jgi:hypothetical protein
MIVGLGTPNSLEAQNHAPTLSHHGDNYLEFHQGLHWTPYS